MSRKGTSAIYISTYYLEIVMQSLPPSGSFNIPSYSGSALFKMHLEHLFGHHDL